MLTNRTAIFIWSHVFLFFKSSTKATFVRKTGVDRNFFHRHLACFQQKFCICHAGADEILMRSHAGFSDKYPGKIIWTQCGNVCELLERNGLVKIFVDV